MNKKKISLIILLTVMVATCFIGCGKKEPRTIAKGEIDISDLISNDEEPEDEDSLEESYEENVEEQVISFECMDEIREASPESGLVQVDDMLLQYGCKVSEIIEVIENSQSEFVAEDYNENELVTPNYPILITFKKNGKNYFGFVAENISTETISLKDCTVTRIDSYKASRGNVFNAGFNGENNNIVTYDSVKNLMKNYEIIMEVSEIDSWEGDIAIRQINLTYAVPSEISLSTGGSLRVEFIFESDMGELKTIKISD